jgi:hypothetical protein
LNDPLPGLEEGNFEGITELPKDIEEGFIDGAIVNEELGVGLIDAIV